MVIASSPVIASSAYSLPKTRQTASIPPSAQPGPVVLISFANNGRLRTNTGDLIYKDEDILQYHPDNRQWAMYFDGSDVGIRGDVNAFSVLDDGSLALSLEAPARLTQIGLVDDSDIIQFRPASLGEDTNGSLSVYLDGSDVGLTTANEDIHALHVRDSGTLLISTNGNTVISGMAVRDEDVLEFSASSFGADTTGTWSLYFDGSEVELERGSEDLRALSQDGNTLHFTTLGLFAAGGINGRSGDIFACRQQASGEPTACQYSVLFKGAASEIGTRPIDAMHYFPATDSTDTTPPSGDVLLNPVANDSGWHNTDVLAEFFWSDDRGIDTNNCDSQLQITSTGEAIPFIASCSDVAGNRAELSGTVSIDRQPPDTTIGNTDHSGDSITISFTGTDDLSGLQYFECSLNNAEFSICSSPVQYENLVTGQHLFTVRSIDSADSTDQTPGTFSWTVDTPSDPTAPTATPTTSPAANSLGWFNTDVTVFFNWLDEQGLDASNCISSVPVSGEGILNYRGTCNDINGNTGEYSGTLSIDKTPPSVAITTYPSSVTNSTDALFRFTAIDGLSGVVRLECQLDENGFTPCTSPVAFENLPAGEHQFEVRASDLAGNSNPVAASASWTIDDTPPGVITAPLASRFLQMASLAATDEDIAAVLSQGMEKWLDDQLAIDEPSSRFDWMIDNGYKLGKSVSRGFDFAVWNRLFTANNPVQQRWVLALAEIFVINVDGLTGPMGWRGFGGAAYLDMLEKHGTGDYRQLLEEITLNLQMGEYLSLKGSKKRDGSGRAPDENYAREILQLFSIGL